MYHIHNFAIHLFVLKTCYFGLQNGDIVFRFMDIQLQHCFMFRIRLLCDRQWKQRHNERRTYELEKSRIAPIGYGSVEYLGKLKTSRDGEIQIKQTEICGYTHQKVFSIYIYVINAKLYTTLWNLHTNLFGIDLTKGPDIQGQVVDPRPQPPQERPVTKPETLMQNILVVNVHRIQGSITTRSSLGVCNCRHINKICMQYGKLPPQFMFNESWFQ